MLALLTRLLQLLLWFVLTFAVAQKSVSAPEKPVLLTAYAAKPCSPWQGEHLHLKDPPVPMRLSPGPERWPRDCDVHPSQT